MKKILDKDTFIAEARKVHGNKYDYSKVDFTKKDEKGRVCIICPEHGEFWQSPYNHLNGSNCLMCSGKKKKTTIEFIEDAKKIHGDKYDYSKVEYINNDTKVCIICHEKDEFGIEHGEFWQTPNKHLYGRGCPKCGGTGKLSKDDFVKKSEIIHKFKYDYSKVEYVSNEIKVHIICPIHGEFEQTPHAHLAGQGCPYCGGTKKLTTEEFIERARKTHGDKYDYSKVEYIDNSTKVCIVCHKKDEDGNEHGEFWQTPHDHLNGNGCAICSGLRKQNNDIFIKNARKIHGDRYDYSRVDYVNTDTKVCIICPKHGEFWQTPHNHLHKQGCPYCTSSKLENDINLLLTQAGVPFEIEKTFEWLVDKRHLYLDFYLPDYKIAIECHGKQHFEPIEYFGGFEAFKNRQRLDFIKYRLCSEQGIKVMYYGDTNNTYFQKIYTDKNELLNTIYESGTEE